MSDVDYAPLSVSMGGVVPRMASVALTANNDARKLVRAGDYVINSRSDRKGSGGIAPTDGSVSVISTVLRPTGILPQFAHHLLRSQAFQEEFYRWGSGIVADLWSTRYAPMSKITLPLPPVHEQREIADFLDRETAKIDALIEKQNELVSILRERMAAKILRETRPIPENLDGWKRIQLRRLALLSTGSTPTGEHADLFDAEGGLGWVTPEDLSSDVRPWRFLTKEGGAQLRRIPPASLLVCGIGATLGKVGYTTAHVATNQQITALIPKRNVVGRYLYFALVAEHAQILGLSVGNTLPIINNARLAQLGIWIPDGTKQDQLARRLQRQTAKVETLIGKAEMFIALAKERRAALITAAITGQIDVMEEAS